MKDQELYILFEKLVKSPVENEWLEFKLNYHSDDEIGNCISALSNGACLHNQAFGYIVFGVEDENKSVVGTNFNPRKHKRGNEEFEHWLSQRLNPKIDFRIYDFHYKGKFIVLLEIPAAINQPISFTNVSYIRIGSIVRKLKDYPEKERKIWKNVPVQSFEKEIALHEVTSEDIVKLLDTQSYFDMLGIPYPTTRNAVLEKFLTEKLITKSKLFFNITNLGAILFAKNLNNFERLSRKAPRVIVYKGRINLVQ